MTRRLKEVWMMNRKRLGIVMGVVTALALFLSFTVFGTNMFGDALRDLLDPRLRGTQ